MALDYEIVMLWVEGPLSYVEQLCAASFRDAGHTVKLYHYGPIENVPEGIEVADGNEILKPERIIRHKRTGSPAHFADVFRYHLLSKRDRVIWADTDAYCVAPFSTDTGYFFGFEGGRNIANGVLGLPRDSDALGQLIDMTKDEYGIPEWYNDKQRAELEEKAASGNPVHTGDLPWGVWGPQAATHYLHKTGEAQYGFAPHVLYPVSFKHRRTLAVTSRLPFVERSIKPDTLSVHFFGRRIRRFLGSLGGLPQPGSYIDTLLTKHGIDPACAPVPEFIPMERKR
ncbi:MAG: hypothetical protein AAF376_11210 [Pseudomonadota bacterium]